MHKTAATYLPALLLLTACEIQVSTTTPDDGSATPEGKAETVGNAKHPHHPQQLAKRLTAAYAIFAGCPSQCATALRKAANIKSSYSPAEQKEIFGVMTRGKNWKFNPREWMENPDPKWLPGWDTFGTSPAEGDRLVTAMALAANRRSWRAACDAQFDDVWAKHKAREKKVGKLIKAAVAHDDKHERIRLLLAARKVARDKEKQLSFLSDVGAPYEVERSLVEHVRAAKVEFVFHERGLMNSLVKRKLGRGDTIPLRPSYGEADERELRCATAGGQPEPAPGTRLEAVRPVASPERVAALMDRMKRDAAEAPGKLWIKAPRWAGDKHTFVLADGLRVTEGSTITVTYAETKKVEVKNCRNGKGKVLRFTNNGATIERDRDCWYEKVRLTTKNTLKIPRTLLPSNLKLKRGDTITTLASRGGGDARNTLKKEFWSYDVAHIVDIKRGSKAILVRY